MIILRFLVKIAYRIIILERRCAWSNAEGVTLEGLLCVFGSDSVTRTVRA